MRGNQGKRESEIINNKWQTNKQASKLVQSSELIKADVSEFWPRSKVNRANFVISSDNFSLSLSLLIIERQIVKSISKLESRIWSESTIDIALVTRIRAMSEKLKLFSMKTCRIL